MVSGGFIGLFIGPVALAVAYQLFWQWVEDQPHIEVLDELPRDEQPRLEETNEHPPA
ncbi:putative inner membrane protein [compost metagenome]